MTTFVLLRIEDDGQARTLVEDIAEYPGRALLTPVQENCIFASVESPAVGAWDDVSDVVSADVVGHVGVTGTRTEPSPEQVAWLREQLAILWAAGYRVLHHGDCTGVDEEAHHAAKGLGYRVTIHPPDNPKHRAFCQRGHDDWLLPERPYLTRNHDIVDSSEFLLACPAGQEINHSGTWATIRYADDTGVPLAMMIRDGTWATQSADGAP